MATLTSNITTMKDIARIVASKTGYKLKETIEIIDAAMDAIVDELLNTNNDVRMTGLGTFVVNVREAHVGRNPRTGEPVDVPDKNVIKFKISQVLKKEINK